MLNVASLLAFAVFATAEVVEPCGDALTISCLAENIAAITECQIPAEHDTSNLKSVGYTAEIPILELTMERYNSTFKGLEDLVVSTYIQDSALEKRLVTFTIPYLTNYGRALFNYHASEQFDTDVDTAFSVVFSNVAITVQWDGARFEHLEINTAIESASYDRARDLPELDAVIKADPNGLPALAELKNAEFPGVFRSEVGVTIGRVVADLIWTNYICSEGFSV